MGRPAPPPPRLLATNARMQWEGRRGLVGRLLCGKKQGATRQLVGGGTPRRGRSLPSRPGRGKSRRDARRGEGGEAWEAVAATATAAAASAGSGGHWLPPSPRDGATRPAACAWPAPRRWTRNGGQPQHVWRPRSYRDASVARFPKPMCTHLSPSITPHALVDSVHSRDTAVLIVKRKNPGTSALYTKRNPRPCAHDLVRASTMAAFNRVTAGCPTLPAPAPYPQPSRASRGT